MSESQIISKTEFLNIIEADKKAERLKVETYVTTIQTKLESFFSHVLDDINISIKELASHRDYSGIVFYIEKGQYGTTSEDEVVCVIGWLINVLLNNGYVVRLKLWEEKEYIPDSDQTFFQRIFFGKKVKTKCYKKWHIWISSRDMALKMIIERNLLTTKQKNILEYYNVI